MVMSCQAFDQSPKLKEHPCQVSATAYSIYSQLSSISGGHLLHIKW